jgi:hypothetical protein
MYLVTASTAGDNFFANFANTGAGAFTVSWTCIPAAASGDEVFTPLTAVTVSTPGRPLKSFDISYVDQGGVTISYKRKSWVTRPYYFLADRSNGAIDVIDATSNTALPPLVPQLAFAGNVPSPPANLSGPNGVILITGKVSNPHPPGCTIGCGPGGINFQQSMQNFVWATDSPSASYLHSTVKVMDLETGLTAAVLNTNGVRRSDELCFNPDPKNPYVMVANDDPLDNYITIWRWDTLALVQKISLAGGDKNASVFTAAPANGIEQCKFNPRNGYFYLSIPATGSPTAVSPNIGDGYVLKISQPVMSTSTHVTTWAKVVAAYDIVPANTGCGATGGGGGPAGLSIGPNSTTTKPPNGYIVLGCGKTGTGSVIIDDYGNTVQQIATAVPINGSGTNAIDETWYDPFGNHFFLAGSGTGPGSGYLFIEDAGGIPPAGSQEDGDAGTIGPDGGAGGSGAVFTGTGSHSVAVYSGTCKAPGRTSRVYVPIRSSLMTPNNSPTICSKNVPGGLGDDTLGCIAVYTAPNRCSGPP